MTDPLVSRRSLLRGALVTVVAGAAGYVVANRSSFAKRPGGPSTGYGSSAGTSHLLAEVDKIPIGGGIVVASAEVVLVRNEQGVVHGLSAICTHEGCTVGAPQDGVIVCPCHGSRFNAQTRSGDQWSGREAATHGTRRPGRGGLRPMKRWWYHAPTVLWLAATGFTVGALIGLH